MRFTEAMKDLAKTIQAGVDRTVTIDPSRVSNLPCVLIEPPDMEADGTMCGTQMVHFRVLAIGLPGAVTALDSLAQLVEDVQKVFERPGKWSCSLSEFVSYVPQNDPSMADPCPAYRLNVEGYYS